MDHYLLYFQSLPMTNMVWNTVESIMVFTGFVGPQIAGRIADMMKSFYGAYLTAATLLSLSFIISLFLNLPKKYKLSPAYFICSVEGGRVTP